MSVTPAPLDDFRPPLGEAIPLLAVVLVVAVTGFTSWFWLTQDESLFDLLPLYGLAALFCIDMILLRNRLHSRSSHNKDIR